MHTNISSKWFWSIIITEIILFSVSIIVLPDIYAYSRYSKAQIAIPSDTDAHTLQDILDGKLVVSIQSFSFGETASPGLPVRLRIPKINVDAALDYVGPEPDMAHDGYNQKSGRCGLV